LEEAAALLYSDKQNLSACKGNLEAELGAGERRVRMLREDIESHMMQRAELIAQREEVEEVYEEFKRQHGAEIAEYIAELEVKDQLSRLKFKKDREISLVKQLDNRLTDLDKTRTEAETELHRSQASIDSFVTASPNKRTEQDIDKLEGFLRTKCAELDIEYFEEVLVETALREGLDIDEEILRRQIVEVDRREDEMTTNWETLEGELKEKAKQLTADLEQLEASMFEDHYDQESTERASAEVRRKLTEVRVSLVKEKRRFSHKHSAVSQWRVEVQTALTELRPARRLELKDAKVVKEFKTRAYERITDSEQRVSLENLMNLYVTKLTSREKYLQDSHVLVQQHQLRTQQLTEQLRVLDTQCRGLEEEKLLVKQRLMKLMMEEKTQTRSLERKGQESPLCSALNQMTKDIEDCEAQIARVSSHIDTALKPQLTELTERLRRVTGDLKRGQAQLCEVEAKEQQIHAEMEALLERQRSFMLNSLEGLQKSARPEDTSLTALKAEVMRKLGQLEAAEAELEAAKSEAIERVMQLSVKESEAISRISQVNEQLASLQGEKARVELLEHKLSDLDNEASQETRIRPKSIGRPFIKKRSVSPQPSQELNTTGMNAAPYLEFIEKTVGKQVQYVADRPAPNPRLRQYFKISPEETSFEQAFFSKVSSP
jgi:chromosome segregation ATPase